MNSYMFVPVATPGLGTGLKRRTGCCAMSAVAGTVTERRTSCCVVSAVAGGSPSVK